MIVYRIHVMVYFKLCFIAFRYQSDTLPDSEAITEIFPHATGVSVAVLAD